MQDRSQQEKALCEALVRLNDAAEARAFLSDLCTPQEMTALAERWEIARLLAAGELSYREISARTGASTTTVSRVARFLKDGYGGYQKMLEQIKDE
ncbi:MAG: helix-turn-helix domain-containing protein [Rhodospirillales bacterium]|nr:helix-turn-helix domain-containing protein [Rhodospirillales bacterium]